MTWALWCLQRFLCKLQPAHRCLSLILSSLSPLLQISQICRNFIVTELSASLSNCIKNWWTNSKDIWGDWRRKESQKCKHTFFPDMNDHTLSFCSAPTKWLQEPMPVVIPVLFRMSWTQMYECTEPPFISPTHVQSYSPFSETYGANSARQDPRQGRQLLWPAIVIPMFWLSCNIYVHDLICKSRWGYRAGQSRWNSTLWPPGGISPHGMTESRKKFQCQAFRNAKAEIKVS